MLDLMWMKSASRTDRPLSFVSGNKIYFVKPDGALTAGVDKGFIVERFSLNTLFRSICENSVYAYLDEIRQGFVTLRGGHRDGVCRQGNM